MRRATHVRTAATQSTSQTYGSVTLVFADRHRRRVQMVDDDGAPFLLDLSHATLLGDGDVLMLEDGGAIRVRAAPESVADIICASAAEMARIAWHIGNRHTPVQVVDGATLRSRDDHVLVDMVEGLGGTVVRRRAPFAPEPGAYAAGAHGNGHGHDH